MPRIAIAVGSMQLRVLHDEVAVGEHADDLVLDRRRRDRRSTFASSSRCMPSVTDSSRVNETTLVVITSRTEVGIGAPCRVQQIEDGGDEVGQVAGNEPVRPA